VSGRIIPFPKREPEPGAELIERPDGEVTKADEPIVGEIVDDGPGKALVPRVVVGRVVRIVRDDRTHHIARGGARHVVTTGQGFMSWGKRAWDGGTHGVYRRQIRAAEAAGDRIELREWLERKESAAEARHKRLMEMPKLAKGIAQVALASVAVLVGLVLIGGVIAQVTGGRFASVVLGVLDTLAWLFKAVAFAWTPFVIAAPFLLVIAAWREGKRRGTPPAWLMTPEERVSGDELITPSIVVKAFSDLGISELRKKIAAMEDGAAAMLSPIKIAGPGVEVNVLLPSGISTADIQKRRKRLAENMGRHEHELFITIPRRARTVTLWIADPGALDQPIEPSPLVTGPPARVSMFRDRAPWGQNLRGDAVSLNLWQKHMLITGLSNMGKTAALRALALWLLRDPTVEFRIADLKGLGDWRMFRDIATIYIEGPTDDHVIEATHMVEDAVAEMERRLMNFDADKYPDGVPPGLAGYHPIVTIVDEAQVAFMCPVIDTAKRPYGGKANNSRFFMACRRAENQGRAVNDLLWLGTQDPTDQNLPKLVREGFHIRASLKVGSEQQSRMALGDNAVNDGAAPHDLKQEHKGTVVVTGMGVPTQQGQTSETVRTHFIDGTSAREIAEQAKQLRRSSTTVEIAEDEEPDLLADLLRVLSNEDERAAQVARRLQDLPGYGTGFNGSVLVARLRDEFAVPMRKLDGYPMVRVRDVEDAVARVLADGENSGDEG
jgi:S-DNA-T family DNA segregation ATPase FtsK/SpoIIIE